MAEIPHRLEDEIIYCRSPTRFWRIQDAMWATFFRLLKQNSIPPTPGLQTGTVRSSTGAPQDTVLAPFLFLIYTADFKYNLKSPATNKSTLMILTIVACIGNGKNKKNTGYLLRTSWTGAESAVSYWTQPKQRSCFPSTCLHTWIQVSGCVQVLMTELIGHLILRVKLYVLSAHAEVF